MVSNTKIIPIRKIFLLSWLIGTAVLSAETINKIEFEGLVHISKENAKEIIKLKSGKDITKEDIDQSIKRLYAQNYFEDIWVEQNGDTLIYHLKEKPIVAKVELKGLSKDKNSEILKRSGLKKGDLYDDRKIKEVKNRIQKDLEAQGYFDSVVEVENKKLNEGSLQTTITVKEGENIFIDKITFHGLNRFKYRDFKHLIENRKRQSFGWLLGRDDGLLKADQLKIDAMKIKEFYLKHGYLDVVVKDPISKTNFENYTAAITYDIKEGDQYRVGDISIVIDDNVIDTKKLKEQFKLKSDKVFNIEYLRKDMQKIQDALSEKGYAFSNIIPDLKQDRDRKIANIEYKIKTNNKVSVNNIIISGNSRTLDRVIRRELYLVEGDLFNQKDLIDSLNSLKRTGYFNDVQIIPKQVSEDKMDLTINVEEASTGSIMGGISYGSYDKFGINAGLSDRNFLGSGIEVGIDIDTSEKTTRGSLNFFNPRVFDSLYSLGGNIFKKNFKYYNYHEKSVGGSLTLGRKISRNIHVSLRYLYEDVDLSDVSESLQDSIFYKEGRTIKSSLLPSISYDSTDDYYLPRSGVNITAGFEYAGIGGNAKFLKNSLSFKYYYGLEDLIDYDLIFRVKMRVSTVNDRGYIPINEKLYLGGMGSVRGFKQGTLAPKNDKDALIGATKMASSSLELSIPLIESVQMRMLTFYDYGMTGDKKFNDIDRQSIGVGIEWARSPLGVPLQLFYAYALDNKDKDRLNRIEFSLGRRF